MHNFNLHVSLCSITKTLLSTTIRHSRSQKLMADSRHCRSPSFIAINPFSLPAKIYSGPFCIFSLSLFFPTPDSTICLSSLPFATHSPDAFPKLPSPFKQHQTAVDGFASAENVQTDGRFVKRRHCEVQRRLPGGDRLIHHCVVRQRLEAFIYLQKLHTSCVLITCFFPQKKIKAILLKFQPSTIVVLQAFPLNGVKHVLPKTSSREMCKGYKGLYLQSFLFVCLLFHHIPHILYQYRRKTT